MAAPIGLIALFGLFPILPVIIIGLSFLGHYLFTYSSLPLLILIDLYLRAVHCHKYF